MTTQPRKRISPLTGLGDVVLELKKIYSETRRGKLDSNEATKLVAILRELRCCFEARDVEARLKALETNL